MRVPLAGSMRVRVGMVVNVLMRRHGQPLNIVIMYHFHGKHNRLPVSECLGYLP